MDNVTSLLNITAETKGRRVLLVNPDPVFFGNGAIYTSSNGQIELQVTLSIIHLCMK